MRQLLLHCGWLLAVGFALYSSPGQAASAVNSSIIQPLAPPPVPVVASPLNYFRQLLAMSPSERDTALANRPAEDKQVLLEKIHEFEVLTPEEREARLQALQHQLDFRTLIKFPSSNRVERLMQLAEADRQYLSDRLRQWDQVAPDIRTAVLTNLILLRFLFPDSAFQSRPTASPYQRALIKNAVDEWNRLPEHTKLMVQEYFKQFFTLDQKHQVKALAPLSATERVQMQKCLSLFAKMPEEQKNKCISGFEKFASLSTQERQEFLANAEKWEKMPPKEREVWRGLVQKYRLPAPPMPPGMIPMPPLPPAATGFAKPVSLRLVSTNQ